MRVIKFNAWIPGIELMLEGVTVYPDMIGIGSDEFEEQLKARKGPRYEIYDDGVYYKGKTDEEDIFDRQLTLLCGEDWYWIEKNDFIPLQLTSMNDGAGEDLFEDDIIKTGRDEHFEIGPVIYDVEHGGFKFKSPDGSLYGITSGDLFTKKIGNMYEHFELLSIPYPYNITQLNKALAKINPGGWHVPGKKDMKDAKKFLKNKK
jgi:hypothetical protein